MRFFLCAFPLVGIVIGLVSALASYLLFLWDIPALIRGAVMTLVPVMITGGIHMDGYADTCDALSSLGDIEKKHQILKDPHIGTFAVIRLIVYFVAAFALWSSLKDLNGIIIILMYTESRILSGLSVVSFAMYKEAGLANMFSEAADKKKVRWVLIIFDLCAAGIFIMQGYTGFVMTVTAHMVFAFLHYTSRTKFGGLSGDLCGWFLCKCEIWMLIALATAGLIGERI